MGLLLSKVLDSMSKLFNQKEARILMLGLDAAGKTSILNQLKLGEVTSTIPTIGFNVDTVQYKNIKFTIWDIGGQKKLRDLWMHYFSNNHALIYVLDSSDYDRYEEAKSTLFHVLEAEELKDAPLLLFANKIDQCKHSAGEITEKMGLYNLRNRQWYVQSSCALTGDGLYDGLNWLSKELKNCKLK